jgi:hypothetical protein
VTFLSYSKSIMKYVQRVYADQCYARWTLIDNMLINQSGRRAPCPSVINLKPIFKGGGVLVRNV